MVGLKEMARLDAERAPPTWLHTLLETRFFDPCPEHPASEGRANRRTTICNFFCTDCAGRALCSGCLGNHEGHELIQIHRTTLSWQRSSGNNVVKLEDVQHLLSVSLVQTYIYSRVHAVFLNRRPMSGQEKPGTSNYEECERGLQDAACRFCSPGCKSKGIEDRLDFGVSFAVNPNSNNAGDKTESEDDDDSSGTSKFQKLGTVSASSSKPAAARGQPSS